MKLLSWSYLKDMKVGCRIEKGLTVIIKHYFIWAF